MTWILAYDVREDPRRARLSAVLQACGDRIQKSVFLLTLDTADLNEILSRAKEIIDPLTDSLYALMQCGNCEDSMITIGQTRTLDHELCWLAL